MMSGGLAFTEGNDMENLRKNSLKGWHLKKFSFLGYQLEKGEPDDVIYAIDYHLLEEEEQLEYFHMFELTGWEHVCSEHDMHIFKAPHGTMPIYTDSDTTKEKYRRLRKPLQKWTISIFIMLLLFGFIRSITSGIIQTVSEWALYVILVLFIPLVMTFIAASIRQLRNTNKNGGAK